MFKRFAEAVAKQVSTAWFFSACVLLVLLWLPSYFLINNVDTWQLIINTVTTIITFLMVALLQNSQEQSVQKMIKQNEDIMTHLFIIEKSTTFKRDCACPCHAERS